MTKITVKLEKQARKSGGDKYSSEGALAFNVYIPQVISRASTGYPADAFIISIDEVM